MKALEIREDTRTAVLLSGLIKDYPMDEGHRSRLRSLLVPGTRQATFRALENINARFLYGRRVGLCGLNGSGKSTLSKIISGVSFATEGICDVRGSVSMLNTNVGLNPNLSGRESIYYKCLLLGFEPEQIHEMEQRIIDFADIGVFIDQPLRSYSSGMRARLGFAISVQLEPDILIVDEALAVGDDSFAEKCNHWMSRFAEHGHSIVFVSHSLPTMRGFCQDVLWLHKGHQVSFGDAKTVLDCYADFSAKCGKLNQEKQQELLKSYGLPVNMREDC